MSSLNDKKQPSDTRATVENIERVTVETIETIERVTITGVKTTAKVVTEFVQVTFDMVVQAQEEFERNRAVYDAIEIDPVAINPVAIDPNDADQSSADHYLTDRYFTAQKQEELSKAQLDDLDPEQREALIRLHEIETSIINELSDEIIISEHSETDRALFRADGTNISDETDAADDFAEEEDEMHMHIQHQEKHILSEADGFDTIRYNPVKILIRNSALVAAKAHAEEDVRNEVGGILLGDYHTTEDGERTALITGIVRARKARQRPASLNFTPEAWADVWRLIDRDDQYGADDAPWKMMGWYHTHPNFGIFFSGADHSVHDPHFTHPCHVALVIDPCRREFGFFAKPDQHTPAGHCNQKQCESLGDKALIARWKKETEHKLKLPKAEIPSDVPEEEMPIEESAPKASVIKESGPKESGPKESGPKESASKAAKTDAEKESSKSDSKTKGSTK